MSAGGPIVAIDGPGGAGKSTVSRELARRLGYAYVDTGAMYRVVALLARERGVDPDDAGELARVAEGVDIRFEPNLAGRQIVRADGRDVTEAIRAEEIGDLASRISTHAEVRERLVSLQRKVGTAARGAVLEGRDIGTVVFPDADLKFFLEASSDERARRRAHELRQRGGVADPKRIRQELEDRDRRDSERAHSPLQCANDAERIDTTSLKVEQVVEKLLARCRERLGVRR